MNLLKGVRWKLVITTVLLMYLAAIAGTIRTVIILNNELEELGSDYRIEFYK